MPQVKNTDNGDGTPDFDVGYGVCDRVESANENNGNKKIII